MNSRLARSGLYFAASTAFGLLSASVIVTAQRADQQAVPWSRALVMELSGAYAFLLLLPVAIAWILRFPIERHDWARRIALHLAFSVALGVAHTLLMWGSRSVLFPWLGWGEYDYGLMRYRFLMEYQKQFLSYGLVYAAVSFVVHVRRAREQELRAAGLRSQLAAAQLDALKMRLQPHFLFNTLNTISSHVHSDPDRADAMISLLSEFLRGTLRHSDRQEVSLEQELDLLHPYLEIMRARFEDRLEVELDVAPETLAALVPHLALQPIVENAVEHGVAARVAPGRVRIEARREGERLLLRVEDDGPGIPGDPAAAVGRGVGLGNLAARLEALHGAQRGLQLTNRPGGGLRVSLDLPWRVAGEVAQ